MALKTEAAESSEISCSPLRPPKRMPTRNFFIYEFSVDGVVNLRQSPRGFLGPSGVQDTLLITASFAHAQPSSRSEAPFSYRQHAFSQSRSASHFFILGGRVRRHLLLPGRVAARLFSQPPRSHRR